MVKKWATWLIVLASVLVYHPALLAFFGSDDFIWLWFSADASSLGHALTNDLALSKLRLTINAYFYLLYHIFHLKAFWYHLANLGLHALNSVLFYRILLRLTADFRLALISALLLATHFALEESLSWVSAVSSVLVSGFGLTSLWLLLKSEENGSRLGLGLSYISFVLALLTKEEAVAFPLIMFIIVKVTRRDRPLTYSLNLLAVALILSAAYVTLRIILAKLESASSVIQFNHVEAISKLFYLVVNLLLPVKWLQDSFPSFWQKITELHHTGLISPFALVALILVVLISKLHRKLSQRTMAIGLLFLFSSLVFLLFSDYEQRFVYVPALSFSVSLAMLLLNVSAKIRRHPWYGLQFWYWGSILLLSRSGVLIGGKQGQRLK